MWQRTDPNTFGQVDRVHVPLSRYLGASFEQGEHDGIMSSMSRLSRFNLQSDDSRILDPEEANALFGIPQRLTFDSPISENRAKMMNREHRDLARREFIIGNTSLASPRGVAGFATQIVGANLNPADIALNFIPIIGQAKYARHAKKATTLWSAARHRLTTGVLGTTDNLVGSQANRRFQAAIINGAVGNAIAEVPLALSNKQFQVRYGWTDFSANVVFGALFAGGIHGLGRAAGKIFEKLDPVRKDQALMKAFADALEGRDTEVDGIIQSDPRFAEMQGEAQRLRNVEAEIQPVWEKGAGQDTQKTWLDLFKDTLVFNHVKSGVESPAVIVRPRGTSARSVQVRVKGKLTGQAAKPSVVTAATHGEALALARKEFGPEADLELGYTQRNGGFISEKTLFEGQTLAEVKMLQTFLRQLEAKRQAAIASDPNFKALNDGDNYKHYLSDKIRELDEMIARAENPGAPPDLANRIGRQQGEILHRLNPEFEAGLLRDGQQARYREAMRQRREANVTQNQKAAVDQAFKPDQGPLKNGGMEEPPPPVNEVPKGPEDPARELAEEEAGVAELEDQYSRMTEEEEKLLMDTELNDGQTLRDVLEDSKWSESDAIKAARDCMLSNG